MTEVVAPGLMVGVSAPSGPGEEVAEDTEAVDLAVGARFWRTGLG
jgi:hypothetical protein